jgi:hypothetical protein
MVHLVNYAQRTLVGVNERSLMEIQSMESVLDLEVYASFLELGNEIAPTIDINSDAGWVQMLNPDQEAYKTIAIARISDSSLLQSPHTSSNE